MNGVKHSDVIKKLKARQAAGETLTFTEKGNLREALSLRGLKRARIGSYVLLAAGVIGAGVGLAYVVDIGHPASDGHVEAPARPVPPGYAVIEMPNHSDNMITFCNYGNRVYKTVGEQEGHAIHVVQNDPSCEGK